MKAPTIRLAHVPGAQGDNVLQGRNGVERMDRQSPTVRLATTTAMSSSADESAKYRYPHHIERADGKEALAPALLVSFVYLDLFLKQREKYYYRDWVMDSGAFSAFHSGVEIKLQEYIDCCKRLLDEDQTLTEVFALDVIGDWQASLDNCAEMWRQGVPAIPCYHVGEPEHVLLTIAADYPKIALGGAVGYKKKNDWARQCFARVWPQKIHGFGFGSEKSILLLPWHSVDATSWEIGPCKFGRWQSFGKMSVRGSKQNLRAEVEFYLNLEQRARQKWRKQMEELETAGPTVRLAEANPISETRRASFLARRDDDGRK